MKRVAQMIGLVAAVAIVFIGYLLFANGPYR